MCALLCPHLQGAQSLQSSILSVLPSLCSPADAVAGVRLLYSSPCLSCRPPWLSAAAAVAAPWTLGKAGEPCLSASASVEIPVSGFGRSKLAVVLHSGSRTVFIEVR